MNDEIMAMRKKSIATAANAIRNARHYHGVGERVAAYSWLLQARAWLDHAATLRDVSRSVPQ